MNRKHVTLIRTTLVSSATSYSIPVTPPIGLAYLAGTLLDQGVTVKPIDAVGERPDQLWVEQGYLYQGLKMEETIARIPRDTSLIGISCMFTQDWPYTRRLIKRIRERFPRVPIIAGGEHMTALPRFSLEDCPELDVCVLGEGEETLAELCARLESSEPFDDVAGLAFRRDGQYLQTQSRRRIRAVDDIPRPARNIFPMETYLSARNAHGVHLGRSMPILSTRGCPYACTFCSNPVMYGQLWIPRKPHLVLDEIEDYLKEYRAENIDFYNLTMVVRRDWILEFCSGIEQRGLDFTWQLPSGTRAEAIDDEVARALYRTGCRNLTYAPESGSVETLRLIKKKVRLPRLLKSVRSVLRCGIKVKCNLIIGFPHETRRHILETLRFAWRMAIIGVHDAPFYLFSPYPGSALFRRGSGRAFCPGFG